MSNKMCHIMTEKTGLSPRTIQQIQDDCRKINPKNLEGICNPHAFVGDHQKASCHKCGFRIVTDENGYFVPE